jgi:glucosyl-3-phosphoglycerate synthase
MTSGGYLRQPSQPIDDVFDQKQPATISVVLPALNEERTIEAIVAMINRDLRENRQFVDELVVMDCGSTDRTREVAAAAGAVVRQINEVLPAIPSRQGKGEALWRSLAATTGDLVAFIDSDLESFTSSYVVELLRPLLCDKAVHLVKAAYERPLRLGQTYEVAGGGRVTEVVARPLLNLYWPELSHLIQPLAGEYAARRSLLDTLAFPSGYGVEIGLLIDTLRSVGAEAISQVDLGVRRHRNRSDLELGRMASEVIQAAMYRLSLGNGNQRARFFTPALTQFAATDRAFEAHTHDVSYVERPPINTIPEYHRRRYAPSPLTS